jgi:uncharacterized protein (UPF0332 family)
LTPVAAGLLARAARDIRHARVNLDAGIPSIAGREAYAAMFHAAQAVVLEFTGKAPKTHAGLRAAFADAARAHPEVAGGLATTLARAYRLKQDADYSVEPETTEAEGGEAIVAAERFVAACERLLRGAGA